MVCVDEYGENIGTLRNLFFLKLLRSKPI